MRNITLIVLLLLVSNIYTQTFIGRTVSSIKNEYVTVEKDNSIFFNLNNDRIILQKENGRIVGEAYNVTREIDLHSLLRLLNKDYEKAEYLDDPKLGQAYLHKEYRIICYKKDFSFIFLIYNI